MANKLNKKVSYRRIKPCNYRFIDIQKLKNNPIREKDDWGENHFTSLKRYFRAVHYRAQKRRCVYCRRKLNPLGLNEHIDHIVARSIKKEWMFKPRNLVLSCYQCNTQKSASPALKKLTKRLPRRSRYYQLFNPYVHNWSAHFKIENDLFITSVSKVGENTIKELKLYDYKYSIVYAEEANIFGQTAIKRATLRKYKFGPNTVEYKSAEKLIKEILRH